MTSYKIALCLETSLVSKSVQPAPEHSSHWLNDSIELRHNEFLVDTVNAVRTQIIIIEKLLTIFHIGIRHEVVATHEPTS